MENSMEVPEKKNFKGELPYYQEYHFCTHIQRTQNHYLKEISALPPSLWPRYGNDLSVHWQLNGQRKCYSVMRTKEILPFATTWMNLEDIMLSEISWTQKDIYCMVSLTCGILKCWTHNNIVTESRMIVISGWGSGKRKMLIKTDKSSLIR